MSSDDKVGYGRPPKSRRFTKGQSGNPSGRPKKRGADFNTVVRTVLSKPMRVIKGGKEATITSLEAVILAAVALAVKGNIQAIKEIIEWNRQLPPEPNGKVYTWYVTDESEEKINEFLRDCDTYPVSYMEDSESAPAPAPAPAPDAKGAEEEKKGEDIRDV
jgi:hypothetical protein